MLEKLDLKRSTYYYHLSHPKRDRYADVRPLVREAFSRTANGMGYRQVALALRNEQGLCISGKTVLRLMREEGLSCKIRRRKYNSYRGEQGKVARNVLDRDFSTDAPMRKLVTDVTEFHQPWGRAYLSPVMDQNASRQNDRATIVAATNTSDAIRVDALAPSGAHQMRAMQAWFASLR